MSAISKRYDFVLLFDVVNGNPNGDPDAGNSPRVDPETGHGLVTDVCLKRKIRNYVCLAKADAEGGFAPGYDIYVKEKAILNEQHRRAYEALRPEGLEVDDKGKSKPGKENLARKWMCQNFFDVRMFGAVMSTSINCGQVRGPVQLAFARSVDPIMPLEQSITRMAVTTAAEAASQGGDNRTMGRKDIVPYALYRGHGFISPHLAQGTDGTGFSDEDLDLLWQALSSMFEIDRSAARGEMATRGLIVFEHESSLGNAPAHALFDRVVIHRKDTTRAPRSFADYVVSIDSDNLPPGLRVLRVV